MQQAILNILVFICFTTGILLQKTLLNPNRGQAMAMPFITSFIVSLVLILIYIISFFCYRYIKSIYCIYFALAIQFLLIIYTTYKYIFYDALLKGKIPIDEWDSDYFPPDSLNYFIIIFISISIFGLGFNIIARNKKRYKEI